MSDGNGGCIMNRQRHYCHCISWMQINIESQRSIGTVRNNKAKLLEQNSYSAVLQYAKILCRKEMFYRYLITAKDELFQICIQSLNNDPE